MHTPMIVDLPDIAGHSLSGTTYTITAAENAKLCDSVGIAPASDGTAHPSWFYIATQVGMGESVADLCALCHFDVNDGPLLAGCEVDFHEPLKTDVAYAVTGEIVDLTRKTSKKLGVMDLLTYRLSLSHDGKTVLTVTNNWFLPRETKS